MYDSFCVFFYRFVNKVFDIFVMGLCVVFMIFLFLLPLIFSFFVLDLSLKSCIIIEVISLVVFFFYYLFSEWYYNGYALDEKR